MIKSQKNQLAIQDQILRQKDHLLEEKEKFSALQTLEIGLLRASCNAHTVKISDVICKKPPKIPEKPKHLKGIIPIPKENLLSQIQKGFSLKHVGTTFQKKRKVASADQALLDAINKRRTRVRSSSSETSSICE
jgi:hypothetical protein